MNRLIAIVLLGLSISCGSIVNAQDKKLSAAQLAGLQKADDSRVAAMREPTKDKLEAIFSDDLHYAHSNASIDTKKSFIEVLTSGKTKYIDMAYEKREFTLASPDIALMNGRVHVKVESGTNKLDSVLSFLAVWRLENGQWKFLAWQSCKVP